MIISGAEIIMITDCLVFVPKWDKNNVAFRFYDN